MFFIDNIVHKNKVLCNSTMHASHHTWRFKGSGPLLPAPKQHGSNVQKQPVHSRDQMTGLHDTNTCFNCLQMKSGVVICRLSPRTVLKKSSHLQQWSLLQRFKHSAHTWWHFTLNVFCLTASLMINTLGMFTMSSLGVNNFDLSLATYKITTYETPKNTQTLTRHSFINTSTPSFINT